MYSPMTPMLVTAANAVYEYKAGSTTRTCASTDAHTAATGVR